MLHGRVAEFERLRSIAQPTTANQPHLAVLYGRRRVGKTFLLQHLTRSLRSDRRPVVYFAGIRESAAMQRHRLAEALSGADVPADPTSWPSMWESVTSFDEPLTVLLDEVPYLIESDPSWPSALQAAWDRLRFERPEAPLTVVLTGSAISTMQSLVSSRGALFERPDTQIRLDPFDLPTAASFIQATDRPARVIEAYTACDGYPLLLARWDVEAPAADNLRRLAGGPDEPLASNAVTMLLDLGDFDSTQRVLGAIGRGATRMSEIHNLAGQRAERPVATLMKSGLVARHQPIDDAGPRAQRFEIADNYLRFWFNIVEPNQQLIDGGQGDAVLRSATPAWDQLVAACFEQAARDHAASVYGPELVIGEWWTNRPTQAQIDVVGRHGNRWKLAGEVKWKDHFDRSDMAQFERALAIAGDRVSGTDLAVWSQLGPTAELAASRPDVAAFTAADVVANRSPAAPAS